MKNLVLLFLSIILFTLLQNLKPKEQKIPKYTLQELETLVANVHVDTLIAAALLYNRLDAMVQRAKEWEDAQ